MTRAMEPERFEPGAFVWYYDSTWRTMWPARVVSRSDEHASYCFHAFEDREYVLRSFGPQQSQEPATRPVALLSAFALSPFLT